MTTTAALPALGVYEIRPSSSEVSFKIRELGLFTVRGTFAVLAGHVEAKADGVTVTAEIDAASFTTSSKRRDRDIRGPKFLDTGRYPTLGFTGKLSADATTVAGVLSGQRQQASVELVIDEVRVDGSTVDVRAHARVDRAALGVTAGRGIIAREVDVELVVRFLRS
ncbi:YceI family protein [Amycolatopsis sp.]|jgi:polyisoprenoid-binding protein YceI|uniref:YceI family protein n=1 Tax=Amycolatopsis sp. TaxID=37632 RepID=UPI002E01770F|nr:YceI family protein [Amycolatopsis sp.]